jgi:hypothetical protein
MPDFGNYGNTGNYEPGEYNQDKAASQLNVANLILVNLVYLIKNSAMLESKLKYGGTQPSVFMPFFTAFREVFDLTSHLIDKKVSDDIEQWFQKVDVKNTKSLNEDIATGLKYARTLKMEIVKLGLLKIFEPPIQPPFMLDPTIDQLSDDDPQDETHEPPLSTLKKVPPKHRNRDASRQKIVRL